MDLKYQLLADTLSDVVYKKVEEAFVGLQEWSDATAMIMLYEIWGITDDKNLSTSDMVNQIKEVYKKRNVDLSVHIIK